MAFEVPHERQALPNRQAEESALGLGMIIFFASLSMLFLASIVGCLIVWASLDGWTLVDRESLNLGLAISTGLLLFISGAAQLAVSACLKEKPKAVRLWLVATFVFAVVFLGNQFVNWADLMARDLPPTAKDLHVFTFYVLTALHAVHVIGGLFSHLYVTGKAFRGYYSPERIQGLRSQTWYWHFLGIAWLLIYASISFMIAG